MKQALFVCLFAAMLVWLTACNRDLAIDAPKEDMDGLFSINKERLEFSNYKVSEMLEIKNHESKPVKIKITGLPEWMKVSEASGVLPPGYSILIFNIDTTIAVPFKGYKQITFANKIKTEILDYNYSYYPPVPSYIMNIAKEFIISRVGEDFFNNNIKIDKHWCRLYPPLESCLDSPFNCASYLSDYYYKLQYYIKSPNIPELGGLIEIVMDTTGVIYYPRNGIEGLPDCIKNPCECQFPISEADALEIARNQLKGEMTYSYVKFFWTSLFVEHSYVWEVRCSVRVENPQSESGFSSSNQIVVIDANSGVVLAINGWAVIP
ncbi:MAG TPA: hypothetical protein PLP19_22510 [bacterium]|nr:hypothetical protein [bacterium]HPN46275.1 hypothetical protein [bacterium]